MRGASKKISLESIVKRDSSQTFSVIDNEVIMLSLKNGEYYALNSVASKIWELIENEIEVKGLIKNLLEEYDIEEEQCIIDTLECLNELAEKNLLLGN